MIASHLIIWSRQVIIGILISLFLTSYNYKEKKLIMSLVKRITIDGTSYDIAPANMDSVPTTDSENPISSGGIKSYLESSYVPLSATQAPVTGLTDILTPVNLLPNSDFSRSAGYATTQTWAETVANTDFHYRDEWTVRTYYNNASKYARIQNLTITNSDSGFITVSGHYIKNTADTDSWVLRSTNTKTLKPLTTYTIRCNYRNVSGTVTPSLSFTGSTTIIYSNTTNDEIVKILTPMSTDTRYPQYPGFYLESSQDTSEKDFSAEFGNLCLYEGEFYNPPIYSSLDTKPLNSFNISSTIIQTATMSMNAAGGRYRLLKLADRLHQNVLLLNLKIMKNWTQEANQMYLVNILITAPNNINLANWTPNMKCYVSNSKRSSGSFTNFISSFQLTYDSDYVLYLSFTCPQGVGGSLYISSYDNTDNIHWSMNVFDPNTPNTTDTVLLSKDVETF
jgi:hypothetical protein